LFVVNWCRGLYPDDEKGADSHRAALLEAIRSKPEITEMAVNPVMLTALAALHWNRRRLPDQRSELYESVLDWLVTKREERRKEARVTAVQCLQHMEYLAFAMHTSAKGKQVEITRDAAARILASRFREEPEDQQYSAAERFLEEEETDSGILISRGNLLRYWHLTFQEYLAAQKLAREDKERRRLLFDEARLYQPEWRETVLLMAGVLGKADPDRVDQFLTDILDALGEEATLAERARCVGLIGRVLQDLRAWKYSIRDARYEENLRRVLAIFDKEAAQTIDFQTRLEAADALGQAGDPRLEQDNWVPIEGGAFWMGAQKDDPNGPNYDPEAYEDESPVRRVEVRSFRMGRYPVTVQEYERFVKAGGYGKEQFWRAGGYGQFEAPDGWERQLRFPNRPVVEVSWYEAAAYCVWAGARLPTEAEWEYAARSGETGFRYPWGIEEPDKYRANFSGGPEHVTPVGMYPQGGTPAGLQDMSGNVLEWVEDWYDQGERRVLRGGSFTTSSRGTCAPRTGPQRAPPLQLHRVSLCPGITFPLSFFPFSLSYCGFGCGRVWRKAGSGAMPRRKFLRGWAPTARPSESRFPPRGRRLGRRCRGRERRCC
jgi:formylglycine-generating enzyme required for sulfatase activity